MGQKAVLSIFENRTKRLSCYRRGEI